jgi:hypothetical protein
VAFDVLRIFFEDFLRESFCFRDDVGAAAAAGEIVITQFDPRVDVLFVFVEIDSLPQRIDHLGYAFETFKRARQTPVSGDKIVVNLDRIAKLK